LDVYTVQKQVFDNQEFITGFAFREIFPFQNKIMGKKGVANMTPHALFSTILIADWRGMLKRGFNNFLHMYAY